MARLRSPAFSKKSLNQTVSACGFRTKVKHFRTLLCTQGAHRSEEKSMESPVLHRNSANGQHDQPLACRQQPLKIFGSGHAGPSKASVSGHTLEIRGAGKAPKPVSMSLVISKSSLGATPVIWDMSLGTLISNNPWRGERSTSFLLAELARLRACAPEQDRGTLH